MDSTKSSDRSDFSVACEHIEQVSPVTCSSAVEICWAEAPAAPDRSIMINNLIVFMFVCMVLMFSFRQVHSNCRYPSPN